MDKTLILGSSGQLGKTFKKYKKKNFFFLNRSDINFENFSKLKNRILQIKPRTIINCAAFTNVDGAEKEKIRSNKINHILVKNLAKFCNFYDILFIHYSTDYVFNGRKKKFLEKDKTTPINYYGKSKLNGEYAIKKNCKRYFIFRVSWLYSIFNKNFPKTIIALLKEKEKINVVNDQHGSPTSCRLVVNATFKAIKDKKLNYGIYHLSCLGRTTWYQIAKFIFNNLKKNEIKCKKIIKISSKSLKLAAKRPSSSYLDCKLLQKKLNMKFPSWKKELKTHIYRLSI